MRNLYPCSGCGTWTCNGECFVEEKQDAMLKLAERLEKRAKDEREIALNSAFLFNLLKPEYDRWDAHDGRAINLYVVRTAIDHKRSAEKDAAFADDLEAAIAALRARFA